MENKRSSIVKNTISRRKHKKLATMGVVVFILAIVGLCYIAMGSIKLTGRIMDNSKEKQRLEHFILPVIMFDPMTFESPQTADPLMILRSSIWSTLFSKNREAFATDKFGVILLPQSDIEVQAAKLFGPDVKLQHQGIEDFEALISYDEESKVYNIPIVAQMAVYTPRIQKITNKEDLIELMVGYIPPGNLWQTDAEGNTYEPEADKVMLMDIKKVKGGYNIVALKDGPNTQATNPNAPQLITPAMSSVVEDEQPLGGSEAVSGAEGASGAAGASGTSGVGGESTSSAAEDE